MKPIKLSELIEALEFDSEEHVTKVDLQNGCVVTVDGSLLSALEENDEEALADLPEWQQRELEVARSIAADSGERFLDAPEKFDFHEYRKMERFIETIKEREMAEQLCQAIKSNGAFRYFKDTASRLGVLKEWYRYRDQAVKEFVRDWAEAQKIPLVDDTLPKS